MFFSNNSHLLLQYATSMFIYTGAVVGVLYLAYFYLRRNPRISLGLKAMVTKQPPAPEVTGLRVESVMPLEMRKNLYVVRYGQERFLLATAGETTQCLSRLNPTENLEASATVQPVAVHGEPPAATIVKNVVDEPTPVEERTLKTVTKSAGRSQRRPLIDLTRPPAVQSVSFGAEQTPASFAKTLQQAANANAQPLSKTRPVKAPPVVETPMVEISAVAPPAHQTTAAASIGGKVAASGFNGVSAGVAGGAVHASGATSRVGVSVVRPIHNTTRPQGPQPQPKPAANPPATAVKKTVSADSLGGKLQQAIARLNQEAEAMTQREQQQQQQLSQQQSDAIVAYLHQSRPSAVTGWEAVVRN
ncbi:MAG: flagellar biosynthetic protein FliO [Candidatus Melainabacteria bacterium]|nr:flagellar biosynthetic protein FliO [Candidatus Melainabacteria bacterium]